MSSRSQSITSSNASIPPVMKLGNSVTIMQDTCLLHYSQPSFLDVLVIKAVRLKEWCDIKYLFSNLLVSSELAKNVQWILSHSVILRGSLQYCGKLVGFLTRWASRIICTTSSSPWNGIIVSGHLRSLNPYLQCLLFVLHNTWGTTSARLDEMSEDLEGSAGLCSFQNIVLIQTNEALSTNLLWSLW